MRYSFVAATLVASVMASPMDMNVGDDAHGLTNMMGSSGPGSYGNSAPSYGGEEPAPHAYGSPEWSSTCTEEYAEQTEAPMYSKPAEPMYTSAAPTYAPAQSSAAPAPYSSAPAPAPYSMESSSAAAPMMSSAAPAPYSSAAPYESSSAPAAPAASSAPAAPQYSAPAMSAAPAAPVMSSAPAYSPMSSAAAPAYTCQAVQQIGDGQVQAQPMGNGCPQGSTMAPVATQPAPAPAPYQSSAPAAAPAPQYPTGTAAPAAPAASGTGVYNKPQSSPIQPYQGAAATNVAGLFAGFGAILALFL